MASIDQEKPRFLLKDHLFNQETVAQIAAWFGLRPGWTQQVIARFPDLELKARIDWIADCLEPELPTGFKQMAAQIEAALPPPLDPGKTDDDFGSFIIAPLGVLATRHGMADPDRALELIEALTQRFSMEFAIRPFLNAHSDRTLDRLDAWCDHPNYHVRRLVSEGTRARLPWAPRIDLDPMRPLAFLDRLHRDGTRYVTRSVANHMGDIAKIDLPRAVRHLEAWRAAGQQGTAELDWMIRHALRAQIKAGAPEAMRCIGVVPGAPVQGATVEMLPKAIRIDDSAEIAATFTPEADGVYVVDYQITFAGPGAGPGGGPDAGKAGKPRRKVFKLKQLEAQGGVPITLSKRHRFKGNATTFTLHPGAHEVALLINGTRRACAAFVLKDLQ